MTLYKWLIYPEPMTFSVKMLHSKYGVFCLKAVVCKEKCRGELDTYISPASYKLLELFTYDLF